MIRRIHLKGGVQSRSNDEGLPSDLLPPAQPLRPRRLPPVWQWLLVLTCSLKSKHGRASNDALLHGQGGAKAEQRPFYKHKRTFIQPAAASGSAAAFAPASPRLQSSHPPEQQLEGDGGDGGGGGASSPPKTYGRDDEGKDDWFDDVCWWWELNNPLSRLVLGVRMRCAADPDFSFKLAVECLIDASIIVTVNLLARREKFFTELEFTLSQIAVSLLNDFALVYLLAPTPECSVLTGGTRMGKLRARLATLPAHVFQQAPGGIVGGYPLSSRVICFAAKGVQYGLVGLVMGIAGSSFVLGLTSLRSALDKGYKPPPTYQPVFGTGLGWLIFMSGNSNIRYNLINFFEDFSYDRFPGPKAKAFSILLRFSNNIFGARAWMHMATKMNLSRPRKQGRRWKVEVAEEEVTALPAAH